MWYNEEKTGKIRIYKNDQQYFGELTWVDLDPGDSGLDENNPDQNLRSKPLVGLLILKELIYEDGDYEDGNIYDPENGKTYSCIMKLENLNRLYVRDISGCPSLEEPLIGPELNSRIKVFNKKEIVWRQPLFSLTRNKILPTDHLISPSIIVGFVSQ